MLPRYLLMMLMKQDQNGKPQSIWFTVLVALLAAVMLGIEVISNIPK